MVDIIGNQMVACQDGVLAPHLAVLASPLTNADWF
jgi:hypothetical protein